MKKGCFMSMIQDAIRRKLFEKLKKLKLSHSKVENVEHNAQKIQEYLQPNTKMKCQKKTLI